MASTRSFFYSECTNRHCVLILWEDINLVQLRGDNVKITRTDCDDDEIELTYNSPEEARSNMLRILDEYERLYNKPMYDKEQDNKDLVQKSQYTDQRLQQLETKVDLLYYAPFAPGYEMGKTEFLSTATSSDK